jgi:hypothetical protein
MLIQRFLKGVKIEYGDPSGLRTLPGGRLVKA